MIKSLRHNEECRGIVLPELVVGQDDVYIAVTPLFGGVMATEFNLVKYDAILGQVF